MSRTAMSQYFAKFLKDEEELVLSSTKDTDKESLMDFYNKSKITPEDMSREYTSAEVRELCERTRVRVRMNRMNCLWDAKKRFDKKNRLDNRSSTWVNRMYLKAVSRGMAQPYTDLEMARYKEVAAANTKKDNIVRLDRWHRQRVRAAALNGAVSPVAFVDISESETQAEAAQSEPEPNKPPPAALESQPQSQSDESSMDELMRPVILPAPAQVPLPGQDSEPEDLWGIGDQDEVKETAEAVVIQPPGGVAETQSESIDWGGHDINSESLSMVTVGISQNTEPDYDLFGTQVVAASTQSASQESQIFC